MAYMHTPTRSPQLQWSSRGLLGLLRASLPSGGADSGQRPGPARAFDDPPAPLSADDLGEIARRWRNRAAGDEERADTVAQALEQLADYRRAAAVPRSRARKVGQKISDFMRI